MNEGTNFSCENGRGARGPKCLDLHEFLSYGFLILILLSELPVNKVQSGLSCKEIT